MTEAEKMMLADAIESAIASTMLVRKWKRISIALLVIIAVLIFFIALKV